MGCEFQNLTGFDLDFRPLENQHTVGAQHAEALSKALAQVALPILPKNSVFQTKPAFVACVNQVRRVKHNEAKLPIGKLHGAKVNQRIRRDAQISAIAKRVAFRPDVTEHGARVGLVEPHHATAAAWVKD